jgi:hypothetical protein
MQIRIFTNHQYVRDLFGISGGLMHNLSKHL